MEVYPIFLPLAGCPFRCIYCDQYAITGETEYSIDSYLEDIANFCNKYSDTYKEIAFFGGTFTAFSTDWQAEQFLKLKPFLNDNTKIRYSTRPDCISQKDLDLAKQYNVGTIELGIQDFTEIVLDKSRRGYKPKIAIEACELIKENNIDLGIQIMPGLPGFNETTFNETLELTLKLQPKYVRVYPTVVLMNTDLEKMYNDGTFTPLTVDEAVEYSARMVTSLESNNIKVIKVGVQIDSHYIKNIIAGPHHQAFGELVKSYIFINDIVNSCSDLDSFKELKISNKDASLLVGHNHFGKKMLFKKINNENIKLIIDNNIRKGYFIIDNNKES